MSRLRRVLAGLTSAALIVPVAGCATTSTNGIAVSGTTRADLVTVAAPRLTAPTVDYTVGIAKLQTPPLIAASRKKAQQVALAAAFSRSPVVAGMLSTVTVQPGDTVKKGQVLAVFDDAQLKLGVQYAEAGYRRVRKGADTLDATADDLRDQKATVRSKGLAALASGRKQMNDGSAQIEQLIKAEEALPGLRKQLAGVEQGIAQLTAALQQLEQLAASPAAPPDVQDQIKTVKANLKKATAGKAVLEQTIAGIQKGIAAAAKKGVPSDPVKARAYVAAMKAKGNAQLASGRSKLNSGLAKMSDGIQQLGNGADTMRTASGVQSAGLASAKNALAQATLRAPCDGVVVSAIPAGQVAMVGAPVVTIRPSVGTLVDTYLTSDQLSGVKAGERVEVTLDSFPGVLSGTVATVWPNHVFPPSNYPTKIVHMSSVAKVTIRLPDNALPRGIPCDVVIHPSE